MRLARRIRGGFYFQLVEEALPADLEEAAHEAVGANAQRLDRAIEAADREAIVGAAKDLVECVVKVVLESLGLAYGGREDLPALTARALSSLKAHPTAFQGRRPVQQLTQALVRVPIALTEVRNRDGTGHGRPRPTDLHLETARFGAEVAAAWVRWVLTALGRILAGMREVNEAVSGIESAWTFRRGELIELLEGLALETLGPDQQRRLGIAVGRRWARRTFITSLDVIQPFLSDEREFPSEFVLGIIEGLFLDSSGTIRCTASTIRDAAALASKLGDEGAAAVAAVAEHVQGADLAYSFEEGEVERELIVEAFEEASASVQNQEIRGALQSIQRRILDLLSPLDLDE